MKLLKFAISFLFLLTMISFEVLNDLTFFKNIDGVETTTSEDVSEKYEGEKETGSSCESKHTIELNLHVLKELAQLRETEWVIIIRAHDLNYQLLEQKVISPPPELKFS